jgi:hypothetical protein
MELDVVLLDAAARWYFGHFDQHQSYLYTAGYKPHKTPSHVPQLLLSLPASRRVAYHATMVGALYKCLRLWDFFQSSLLEKFPRLQEMANALTPISEQDACVRITVARVKGLCPEFSSGVTNGKHADNHNTPLINDGFGDLEAQHHKAETERLGSFVTLSDMLVV